MIDTNKWEKGEINKSLNILKKEQIVHLSQELLHRIHTFFLTPSVTRDVNTNTISEVKLEKGRDM